MRGTSGDSGVPKGMVVKRDPSGTVGGFREGTGCGGQGLTLMATLGSTAVTLLPFLPLPTCPQATNIQGLEYITKGKGKHSKVSKKTRGSYAAYSRLHLPGEESQPPCTLP